MTRAQLKILFIGIWENVLTLGIFVFGLYFWESGALPAANTPSAMMVLPAPQASATPVPPSAAPFSQGTVMIETLAPEFAPSATAAVPTLPVLPSSLPPDIDPLTGLAVGDVTRLERNPISVKITTFPRHVRGYQFGLTLADVVYEYYIEDELTRFIAVFYGQDAEKAGPVRSGRYFDEHVARMYQAYLVFANADERVEAKFLNQPDLLPFLVLPRDDNCPPLCRDTSIKDYNNIFVNTRGVTEYQAKTGHKTARVPLRPTYFNLDEPLPGIKVDSITIRYSQRSYHIWKYDALTRRYWRESDAQDSPTVSGEVYTPHIDRLNGQQISAANVVVLIVPHLFNNDYDRTDQVFNIALINSGAAYIFREGRAQAAFWRRDQAAQPIQLTDESGRLLPLSPGNTFYLVLNPESVLQQWERAVRFTFFIPPRVIPQP